MLTNTLRARVASFWRKIASPYRQHRLGLERASLVARALGQPLGVRGRVGLERGERLAIQRLADAVALGLLELLVDRARLAPLALALERSATQLATVNSANRVVPEDQAHEEIGVPAVGQMSVVVAKHLVIATVDDAAPGILDPVAGQHAVGAPAQIDATAGRGQDRVVAHRRAAAQDVDDTVTPVMPFDEVVLDHPATPSIGYRLAPATDFQRVRLTGGIVCRLRDRKSVV